MRMLSSLFLVPALICALAGQGLAQESAPGGEKKWYGGQIIVADVLSYGVFLAGVGQGSAAPAVLGASSFLVTPAVIHGVHHHGGRSALSVLMRLGLPVVGALVGYGLADCPPSRYVDDEDPFCGWGQGLIGLGLGMVAASIVDASIAWDTVTPAPAMPPAPPTSVSRHDSISFTSAGIVPTANGPRLMIGGRF